MRPPAPRRPAHRRGPALALLLAAVLPVSGCRPIRVGGLPSNPEQLYEALTAMECPGEVHVSGRLRTAVGGVEMNLGMDLLTDCAGNARLDLSYPFGGRAASLVLQEDRALLGTAGGQRLVLYTPDAGDLVQRWVGGWAEPSMLIDLLLGRVPASFDGAMAWAEHDDERMLAMELDGANTALLGVDRRPTRLRRLVVLDPDRGEVAAARWDEWAEVDGAWYPTVIELQMPDPVGRLEVQVEAFERNPVVIPDAYRVSPPESEYLTFEQLFDRWRE